MATHGCHCTTLALHWELPQPELVQLRMLTNPEPDGLWTRPLGSKSIGQSFVLRAHVMIRLLAESPDKPTEGSNSLVPSVAFSVVTGQDDADASKSKSSTVNSGRLVSWMGPPRNHEVYQPTRTEPSAFIAVDGARWILLKVVEYVEMITGPTVALGGTLLE